MDYVKALVGLGYNRCCAESIVKDYTETGKVQDLEEYISIKTHVAEVLG